MHSMDVSPERQAAWLGFGWWVLVVVRIVRPERRVWNVLETESRRVMGVVSVVLVVA